MIFCAVTWRTLNAQGSTSNHSRGPSFPLTARGSVSCYGVSAGRIAVARMVAATMKGMDALLADWNQGG